MPFILSSYLMALPILGEFWYTALSKELVHLTQAIEFMCTGGYFLQYFLIILLTSTGSTVILLFTSTGFSDTHSFLLIIASSLLSSYLLKVYQFITFPSHHILISLISPIVLKINSVLSVLIYFLLLDFDLFCSFSSLSWKLRLLVFFF